MINAKELFLVRMILCGAICLYLAAPRALAQTTNPEVERLLSDWPPAEGHRPITQIPKANSYKNSYASQPIQQPIQQPQQQQISENQWMAPGYAPPQNYQQNYQPNYAPENSRNYPPAQNFYQQQNPNYPPAQAENIPAQQAESYAPQQRKYDSRGARMAIFEHQESLLDAMKISFGAGLGYRPEFPGSGKNEYMPLPVIDVRYRDTFFLNTFRGAGYNLFNTYDFKAGPALTFDFGRDSSDASYLNGFADIDPTIESGFFLEKRFTPNFGVSWDIRNDSLNRGHEGVKSNLALEGDWQMNDQLMLNSSLGTSWASENYMESYFGVTNAQSAESGLSAYSISSGFKDIGADVGARFALSEKISLAGTLGIKRLIGDAADSPIVKRGDSNQYTGGAYAVYSF